jgi:Na+/melibiose symporter-like transporter
MFLLTLSSTLPSSLGNSISITFVGNLYSASKNKATDIVDSGSSRGTARAKNNWKEKYRSNKRLECLMLLEDYLWKKKNWMCYILLSFSDTKVIFQCRAATLQYYLTSVIRETERHRLTHREKGKTHNDEVASPRD